MYEGGTLWLQIKWDKWFSSCTQLFPLLLHCFSTNVLFSNFFPHRILWIVLYNEKFEPYPFSVSDCFLFCFFLFFLQFIIKKRLSEIVLAALYSTNYQNVGHIWFFRHMILSHPSIEVKDCLKWSGCQRFWCEWCQINTPRQQKYQNK